MLLASQVVLWRTQWRKCLSTPSLILYSASPSHSPKASYCPFQHPMWFLRGQVSLGKWSLLIVIVVYRMYVDGTQFGCGWRVCRAIWKFCVFKVSHSRLYKRKGHSNCGKSVGCPAAVWMVPLVKLPCLGSWPWHYLEKPPCPESWPWHWLEKLPSHGSWP